tara:strand:+ start:744 stop:1268 length:525 start_codon:yes stop_codon:yes gene_type:complete
MRDLLTIVDYTAVPSPYALSLDEFSIVAKRKNGMKELAYVYYMCNHNSPFYVYDHGERDKQVKDALFKDSKWKPDPKLKACMDVYNELSETSAVKLLKAAKTSIAKLEKYLRFIDLTSLDDNGKPIYTAKDLIYNLEKMGKVVEGLSKLEELVRKEEKVGNKNRGGVEVNKYSM